jgi:hypothetical protein
MQQKYCFRNNHKKLPAQLQESQLAYNVFLKNPLLPLSKEQTTKYHTYNNLKIFLFAIIIRYCF